MGMFSLINIFKAFAGICNTPPLVNDEWKVAEGKLIVSQDGLKKVDKPGAAVYMAGNQLQRPVLLIKTKEGNFRAYASACTHMGRKLDYLLEENKLRCCSVNHSSFDLDGNKLTGPAKGNITEYQVEREGTDLIIKITQ